MTTSVEYSMAQKILKTLDEHGKALKKMGGCLTRLEESKLKKPSHVEIHDDEEEVEEWDEKDKAEYERIKQFETKDLKHCLPSSRFLMQKSLMGLEI